MTETGIARVDNVLGILADREQTLDNRAAAYAVAQQIKLRLDRGLKAARDDLIRGMQKAELKELGPVSIKSSATDVEYRCNDEANFGDINVQEAMALYARMAPEYFRHVPDHWEVRTAELGQGVAGGDPVARQLHSQMKEHGWRTEGGRRLSLAVREVRPVKKKVAA